MAKLIVLNDPDKIYEFDEGQIVIGRLPECQICIPSSGVSRRHASLTYTEAGWLLEDLGSHNGLFLHNVRIESKLLQHTTTFRVGNVYIRFEQEMSKDELLKIARQMTNILEAFCRTISWQSEIGRNLLIAALAGKHVLLEGKSEDIKVQVAKKMASILKMNYASIIMTPDTLPQDVLGKEMFVRDDDEKRSMILQFVEGPIFSNMLLVRAINHAPARLQAALLEALEAGKVQVGQSFQALPEPQVCIATDCPLDSTDNTPLSLLMLDSFALSMKVDYPSVSDEKEFVLKVTGKEQVADESIWDDNTLWDFKELLQTLVIPDKVMTYAGQIIRQTRPDNEESPDFIKQNVLAGASTRAMQDLVSCAKARALLEGRLEISCDDVREMAIPVLRHRIALIQKNGERQLPDAIIRRLLVTIQP